MDVSLPSLAAGHVALQLAVPKTMQSGYSALACHIMHTGLEWSWRQLHCALTLQCRPWVHAEAAELDMH